MLRKTFWSVVLGLGFWLCAGFLGAAGAAAGTDVVDLSQAPGAAQAPAQSDPSWRQQNIAPIIQLLKQQAEKLEALDARYPGQFTDQVARLKADISLLESDRINIAPTWTNLTTVGEWFKLHFVETDAKAYVWPGTRSIWIYEQNFNTLTPEEKASVLLHELNHIKGGGEKEAYIRQYEYLRLLGKTDEPGRHLSGEMVNVLDNLAQLGVIPQTKSNLEPFKKDALDASLGLDVLYPIVRDGLDAALAASSNTRPGSTRPASPPREALPPSWSPAFTQVQNTGHSFGPWAENQLYNTPQEAAQAGLRAYLKNTASGSKYYDQRRNMAQWSGPVELWQSGRLADGYSVYTYGATFTPLLWDGSDLQEAEERLQIDGGAGQFALLLYVQSVPREVQGKPTAYALYGVREYVPNRPPVVEEITCEGTLRRGQSVVWHARTSDPDGDTVLVRWYVETWRGGSLEWRHIGDGRDLTWAIPANLYGCDALGAVRAYAVDSKGGIGRGDSWVNPATGQRERISLNLTGQQEYIDVESVTQEPAAVDAGKPVTLTALVRAASPGELRAAWTVNGAPLPAGPVTPLGLDQRTGAYRYKVQCTMTAVRGSGGESTGTLVVENVVNGSSIGKSPTINFRIVFTDKDYQEKAAAQQQDRLASAAAILSRVAARAGELQPNLQVFQRFNLYQIGNQLVDVNSRLQHYLRWRAGQDKADQAWGQNYTVSLLHGDLDALLKSLQELAPTLGLSGGAAAAEALTRTDYSEETLKIKLAAAVQGVSAVTTLQDRAAGYLREVQQLDAELQKAGELAPEQHQEERARLGGILAELKNITIYPNVELLQQALAGLRDGAAKLGLAATGQSTAPASPQPPAAAGGQEVTIMVNNQVLRPDVPARVINGRTMVPVRFVAQALNCAVDWDQATSTVIITSPGKNRARPPVNRTGRINILVDGRLLSPDVPPLLLSGRTMVPVRFVAEALGATVDWNGATQTVLIKRAAGAARQGR